MHVLFLMFTILVTSSASARERTTIAVVGIHQETITADAQNAAVIELADTIKKSKKFDALLPIDLTWLIQGREEVILQEAFSRTGRRFLDDGKTLYAQAQPEEAIPILEAAAEELTKTMSVTQAQALLWEALFTLGTAQLAVDASPEHAWTQAIVLNPDREPNSSQYPPDVIAQYQALQEQKLSQRGTLTIESSEPGVKVWVNGEPQGHTPLTLKNLPIGKAHVLGRTPQGFQSYQQVTVAADTSVTCSLAPSKGRWSLPASTTRTRVRLTSDLYRSLGAFAEVDLILVVGETAQNKASLQLYSPRMDAFSRPLDIATTGSITDELKNALPELLQLATEDGAILSMATTADAAALNPGTNTLLGRMMVSPTPVAAPPGGKIKWWHMALAGGGALAVGGVATGIILSTDTTEDPNQGTIIIGPIP